MADDEDLPGSTLLNIIAVIAVMGWLIIGGVLLWVR